jgi:integrase
MNQIAHFEERVQAGTWLIDWRVYDRTPVLSEAEAQTLAWYVQLRQGWPAVPIREGLPPGLQRVYVPLTTALDALEATDARKTKALFLLLTRVHVRQELYWRWEEDDWLQILHEEPQLAVRSQQQATGLPLIACAYLLTGFCAFPAIAFQPMLTWVAKLLFGVDKLQVAVNCVAAALEQMGYSPDANGIQILVSRLLLYSGSDAIETVTPEAATYVLNNQVMPTYRYLGQRISDALLHLGVLSQPAVIKPPPKPTKPKLKKPKPLQSRPKRSEFVETAAPEWQQWCQRWCDASPLQASTQASKKNKLLRIGRWLQGTHPDVSSPEQWTREIALAFVADVCEWYVGDWAPQPPAANSGNRLGAKAKANIIATARGFFSDCQQWHWLPKRFDPTRCLRPPPFLRGKIIPNPAQRVIDAPVWARLVWAGLHLDAEDVALFHPRLGFPYEMVKAIAIAWLFCGLRPIELHRLRLGCIRWPRANEPQVAANPICYLEVPPSKKHMAYTKPVEALVGEAIMAWERVRPPCPALLDEYTSSQVDYLFCYQGQQLSASYFSENLIPMLCNKASIPAADSKGRITCARARTTIASQLANSEQGMSALALSNWLGHKTIKATLHYFKDSALTLTKAYTDAGYFGRNVRMVELLIDQEAILTGAALQGAPWKYYDLGHGYCTYDFFDQCPHRMACAKCTFYRPKAAIKNQLHEAQGNLIHMLQQIPLTEAEQAAVVDGLTAVSHLYGQLADTVAPDGRTPYQVQTEAHIINVNDIDIYPGEDRTR